MENEPMTIDINHLHGQVVGQRALILALAGLALDREEFRAAGLKRLEEARTAFLVTQAPEKTRDGIDAIETWLLTVTG